MPPCLSTRGSCRVVQERCRVLGGLMWHAGHIQRVAPISVPFEHHADRLMLQGPAFATMPSVSPCVRQRIGLCHQQQAGWHSPRMCWRLLTAEEPVDAPPKIPVARLWARCEKVRAPGPPSTEAVTDPCVCRTCFVANAVGDRWSI